MELLISRSPFFFLQKRPSTNRDNDRSKIETDLPRVAEPSWLESDCQAELGGLFQGLCVKLSGDCEQRFGYDLVLKKSPELTVVVQLRFHGGPGVHRVGPTNRESILIGREFPGNLSNCCALLLLIKIMDVRGSYAISLVTPNTDYMV